MIYEHPESKNATLGPIQTCSASSVAIFVSFSAQSQLARQCRARAFRALVSRFSSTRLPWVPEVFLACGGNFWCWPKPRAGHYKDSTETGNRARKVSGIQGSTRSKIYEISMLIGEKKSKFYPNNK